MRVARREEAISMGVKTNVEQPYQQGDMKMCKSFVMGVTANGMDSGAVEWLKNAIHR